MYLFVEWSSRTWSPRCTMFDPVLSCPLASTVSRLPEIRSCAVDQSLHWGCIELDVSIIIPALETEKNVFFSLRFYRYVFTFVSYLHQSVLVKLLCRFSLFNYRMKNISKNVLWTVSDIEWGRGSGWVKMSESGGEVGWDDNISNWKEFEWGTREVVFCSMRHDLEYIRFLHINASKNVQVFVYDYNSKFYLLAIVA